MNSKGGYYRVLTSLIIADKIFEFFILQLIIVHALDLAAKGKESNYVVYIHSTVPFDLCQLRKCVLLSRSKVENKLQFEIVNSKPTTLKLTATL
jgi:hypothetical protein